MSKFITNSFQLPNAIVDDMLCKLSGNACKIYLLIVRKTRGWHKEADKISYSQIQKYTGINHRATVSKAIDELLEIGLISVQKGNEKTMSEYRLNDDFCGSKNELAKNCTSSKNELTGSKNELETGSKNEHTEIQYNKNTNTKYNDIYTHDENEKENFQTSSQTKPSSQKPSAKKTNTVTDQLIHLGVSEQAANDFVDFRKQIKKPMTITAIKALQDESTEAGLSLEQAIEYTLNKGWQSFTAAWYQNQQQAWSQPTKPTTKPNRMAEFAEQSSQWGDDFYSKQPTLALGESK